MNGRHTKGSHMDEKAYERLAILFALVGDIGYDVNPVPKRIHCREVTA